MEQIENTLENPAQPPERSQPPLPRCCIVRFRPGEQLWAALSRLDHLRPDEIVMVQTDHGLEPAVIRAERPSAPEAVAHAPDATEIIATTDAGTEPVAAPPAPALTIIRRANREEQDKYQKLLEREKEAFSACVRLIAKHQLPMKLIRVERFFNGSKIIFYFTAENRVDFRELVKDLVQEFRTRVEIRQVGVRHETKMIGGLGCCGRELCCASFINNFAPVSIKMAKEQGLPLNPAKISGICNRLLCCLTYEYETYHQLRRQLPKPGKTVTLDDRAFKINRVHVLEETVEVTALDEPERPIIWQRSEWQRLKEQRGSKPEEAAVAPAAGATVETGRPRQDKRSRGKKQER